MNAVLLHGLLDDAARAAVETPPHKRLFCGGLSALVSQGSHLCEVADDSELMLEAALDHHQILTGYSLFTDVLPIQFGTAFSSEDAVVDAITGAQDNMAARLGHLRHRQEYLLSLHVTGMPKSEHEGTEGAGGRNYLRAKQSRRDARHTLRSQRLGFARDLTSQMATVAEDAEALTTNTPEMLLKVALLVDRRCKDAFVDFTARADPDARALGLKLRLTGPGPCYTFATGSGDAALTGAVRHG